jgi:hypothetical protein
MHGGIQLPKAVRKSREGFTPANLTYHHPVPHQKSYTTGAGTISLANPSAFTVIPSQHSYQADGCPFSRMFTPALHRRQVFRG